MRTAWYLLAGLAACAPAETPPSPDVPPIDNGTAEAGTTPDIPGVTPDIPGVTPDIPGVTPDIPGVTPDIPGVTPDIPGVTPDIPGVDGAVDRADVPLPPADGGAMFLDRPRPDATIPRDAPDAAVPADRPDTNPRDVAPADVPPGAWRSALFPDDWRPLHAGGRPDGMGRFLHDLSTAGYHRGDDPPPYGRGTIVRRVDAALGDGNTDARAALQAAIDEACADPTPGLRVVFLPAGVYRLRFPTATPATDPALRIGCSNLVLRGAGPARSRLFLDDAANARQRAMLLVRGAGSSVWSGGVTARLTQDLPAGSIEVPLESVAGFAPGELVALRTELTEGFRADHRMNLVDMGTTLWNPSANNGLLYPRRVVRVDAARRVVRLDAPTRYLMKTRDNARALHPAGYLREVGLEDLGFGMREHPTSAMGSPGPLGDAADEGYTDPGTAAYAVHASVALRFDGVTDAWVHNVESWSPPGNASGAHLLSNAIFLTPGTHRVTVEDCRLQRPQYRGGGGNGYLFWNQGNDNLVRDVEGVNGRHNLIMAALACSGNVWLRARSTNGRYSDDSHAGLAQANLYDGVILDRAWLQAVNRGATSSGAGFTATATVFWNTRVVAIHPLTRRAPHPEGVAVETAQFGWGYAIGTQGPGELGTRSFTNGYWATLDPGAPTDWTEGEGRGATLYPASLYEEQLRRRWLRGE